MAFPVLLYHSISPDPAPGIERWTTSPAEFERHIELIRASGRTPLTVTELVSALESQQLPERPVVVTFDDGFTDNIAAAEQLHAAAIPATIYVTSGYLDRPRMLDARALRELSEIPGIEIGAHSVSHPRLDELSAEQIADEVRGSRERIEEVLGAKISSFAYPHGAHDRRAIAAVRSAGFSSAAAVRNALSHPQDNRWRIARLTIEASTTAAQLERALAGTGFPVAATRERPRTVVYRYVRRARRQLAQRAGTTG